jgi:hypothetical protein
MVWTVSLTNLTLRSSGTPQKRGAPQLNVGRKNMPFYRFHIESPFSTQNVLERIHGLVRDQPAFWSSIKEQFGSRPNNSPPFIGKIEGSEFHIHRDIRYRNSFLPRISGKVSASRLGTQIKITMSLHPFVAIFILFWLGSVGIGGFAVAHKSLEQALIPLGMFIFGVALTLGGFYPEAIKARHLLEQSLTGAQQDAPGDAKKRRG